MWTFNRNRKQLTVFYTSYFTNIEKIPTKQTKYLFNRHTDSHQHKSKYCSCMAKKQLAQQANSNQFTLTFLKGYSLYSSWSHLKICKKIMYNNTEQHRHNSYHEGLISYSSFRHRCSELQLHVYSVDAAGHQQHDRTHCQPLNNTENTAVVSTESISSSE